MSEAEQIAAKLTEAQRAAFLRDTAFEGFERHEAPCWIHVLGLGLVRAVRHRVPEPHWAHYWTPLGLAVRQILQGDQ